jgi:SPP1 gp7 family putative phage head morphogenesis protein
MATSNEEARDAMLRRQVGLLQLSDQVTARLLRILNESEPELRGLIEHYVGLLATVDIYSKRGMALSRRVEQAILSQRGKAYARVSKALVKELDAIAVAEAEAIGTLIQTVLPVEIRLGRPTTRQLRTIARELSPRGATLERWFNGINANEARLLAAQIAAGAAQGQKTSQIVRSVLGTRSMQGADGLTSTARNNTDALVRTAIMDVADRVRQVLFSANEDILDEEQYVATLDSRTTPVCRSLDGKRFPVGTGPRPPMHWRCRSVRVPVFNGTLLGTRPAKPVTEAMLRREYAQANTSLNYRQWKQRRIRELVGPVPAVTTYQDWLARQSEEFQNEVLGETRAELFRDGGLTLERFVNRASGRQWTLAELARRETAAFRSAGLDLRRYR